MKAIIGGGLRLQTRHLDPKLGIQPIVGPDKADADPFGTKPRSFLTDISTEKPHETLDLLNRSLPILGGKGEQRKMGDAEIGAALHNFAHTIGPAPVALQSRQSAVLCPTPVAIHDYGDMRRTTISTRHFPCIAHSNRRLSYMSGNTPARQHS
jgi:hypothetical protein